MDGNSLLGGVSSRRDAGCGGRMMQLICTTKSDWSPCKRACVHAYALVGFCSAQLKQVLRKIPDYAQVSIQRMIPGITYPFRYFFEASSVLMSVHTSIPLSLRPILKLRLGKVPDLAKLPSESVSQTSS